ncbi:Fic family protein [[Eubacterium] hominis]|uniref:Fic family protein n=1 Tax=[Eubacterium] hominis TaxID=2764325 RepID=UPI003A4E361D
MAEKKYDVKRALREQKKIKMKGNLYHLTQVSFAYNSNHIEGSRLTQEQTRMIFETNTILPNQGEAIRYNDIIETHNHFRLFDYMLDHCDDELDTDLMKKFHEILKNGSNDAELEWFRVGDWKLLPNIIGDHTETVAPEDVEKVMTKLLNEYHAKKKIEFEDIVDFHYRFESIHGFQDGNGRVGRMIMFKECLKHDIVPFIIEDIHKSFYYRGLKEYSSEKGYLMDTCLNSQDRYMALYDELVGNLYQKKDEIER